MSSEIISTKTDKGIPVFYSRGDADLVNYKILVKAGSRCEPIDGISHIMEHMSFKGTENRSKDEIQGIVNSFGGDINAFTSHDWIQYETSGHSSGSTELLDALTELVCIPSIKGSELEPEKKVIIQEMVMRDNNPSYHFYGNLVSGVWRGSAMEHKIIGDEASVNGTTVDDLRGFHRNMFTRGNIAVIATGNIDPEAVLGKIDDTIGMLPAGGRTQYEVPRANDGRYLYESSKGNRSCYVSAAFPAHLSREENASLDALCDILSGGLSSRLYKELREKRSLIYALTASAVPFLGCETFTPGFTCTENNVREGISAMFDILREIRDNPVTEEELRNYRMKDAVSTETKYDSAKGRSELASIEYRFYEKVYTPEERRSISDSVTVESILALAQRIMNPDRMHLVVYGTETDGMSDFDIGGIDI